MADLASAKEIAAKIGYPLLIKASAGGGGRGIRPVYREEELESQMRTASEEAASCFGCADVYMERLLLHPRHVEVQILADSQGNVVHLGERDCSMQRRKQKLMEESPAPADGGCGSPGGKAVRLYQCGYGGISHRREGIFLHGDEYPDPGGASCNRGGHRH